jgi:starch phosphorylase
MHHDEVSRGMFPEYPVHAITNGVHAVHWTSQAFQTLSDRHIPDWRRDNLYLRYAVGSAPVKSVRHIWKPSGLYWRSYASERARAWTKRC